MRSTLIRLPGAEPELARSAYPESPLTALDTLWFQVAGTLCNLQCTHCFISCSPDNHSQEMMSLKQVQEYLKEAETLGVRDYYFTGGEPFMNRDLLEILRVTLRQGPATVLTNGTLITARAAAQLQELFESSEYSLDIRISLDGYDGASNDPIRGAGSFARIMKGMQHLAEARLNPVVTVTEACDGVAGEEGRHRFLEFLRQIGLTKPRLKILPLLLLGAETKRSRAYQTWETLKGVHLSPEDAGKLQCGTSRIVTAKGVYVCPILVDYPGAKMGETLAATVGPFPLSYPACHTCLTTGLTCRT